MDVLNLQNHPPSQEQILAGTALGWCQSQPGTLWTLCWASVCPSLTQLPSELCGSLSPSPSPAPSLLVTGWPMAKDPHHTVGSGYSPVLWGFWGCKQPEMILNLHAVLGAGALDSSLSDSSAKSPPEPVRVTPPPCGHFWKCTRGGPFQKGA